MAGEDPPRALNFWCPACNEVHSIRVGGGGAWTWNGNEASPTVNPSVKCEQPKWNEARREFVVDRVCHLTIADGKITYCPDCTHGFANRTVPMVEF